MGGLHGAWFACMALVVCGGGRRLRRIRVFRLLCMTPAALANAWLVGAVLQISPYSVVDSMRLGVVVVIGLCVTPVEFALLRCVECASSVAVAVADAALLWR